MAGNSFGAFFRVTTFGESHGVGVGCVIDGCPPLLALDEKRDSARFGSPQARPIKICHAAQRAGRGGNFIRRFRRENDRRADCDSHSQPRRAPARLRKMRDIFRPRTRRFCVSKKIRNPRLSRRRALLGAGDGGGRGGGSGRAAMAGGEIPNRHARLLDANGRHRYPVRIVGRSRQKSVFRAQRRRRFSLGRKIESLRRDKDSCGARIRVVAENAPPGWGEPVFDRLDADLAKALMGINAVKAVSIGDGFESVRQRGSEHSDEMTKDGFESNHTGGILGGISTGQNITAEIGLKPTSSIAQERPHDRRARQRNRHSDNRSPRPLRGLARGAHRRSDDAFGFDRPRAAPTRPMRRLIGRRAKH